MSDQELIARLRHEQNKQGWCEEIEPLTGHDRAVLVDRLSGELKRLQKRPTIAKLRRERVEATLYAWGEFYQGSGAQTGLGRAVDNPDQVGVYDGYDRGLSDHASRMINIEMVVSKLNEIDRVLIEYAYKDVFKDARHRWCVRFGRKQPAYSKRKSRLLDQLASKI